jgi:transcriptional regulator with XRE-family HTH domain
MTTMCTRIRDLREDRKLTKGYIANHLKCDRSLYSRYERGERPIPLALIVKLAEFYHTSLDYLVGLTDKPTPYPRKSTGICDRRTAV